MRLKKGLCIAVFLCTFLLQGCKSDNQYTAEWIQDNVDLSLENKMILVSDSTLDMLNLGITEMFFMEYGKCNEDWSFGYNIGGYCLEYYCVDEKQTGILRYAEELERYDIEGSMDESRIAKDISVVKDLFNIDFQKAKVKKHEDSDDGLDVVSLSTKEKVSVLFLDKETSECRRLEVGYLDDNGKISELFLAVPTPVTEIILPEDVDEIEVRTSISAEDYSSFCSRFIFSSLINASMNEGLDSASEGED